ncbi:hypothetical protein CTI12_AA180080 [Artemisia annua]|uniref:C3H1-type domain-containing protein n=1 Tax=Artemisia annua TaxID=35608 RepID=A0A2U1P939_ARTAN|nr:hypothetical protein CTI12_AA180080 [Artemisia annua]
MALEHHPPPSSDNKGNTNTPSNKTQNLPPLCTYFNKGTCKFGDRCKFIHDHRNKSGLKTGMGQTLGGSVHSQVAKSFTSWAPPGYYAGTQHKPSTGSSQPSQIQKSWAPPGFYHSRMRNQPTQHSLTNPMGFQPIQQAYAATLYSPQAQQILSPQISIPQAQHFLNVLEVHHVLREFALFIFLWALPARKTVVTSDHALKLEFVPDLIATVGCGYMALNVVMCTQHLIVRYKICIYFKLRQLSDFVTFIEALDQLMPGFDPEISKLAQRVLINPRKIDHHTCVFARKVDAALIFTGRAPFINDLSLENVPHIYCIGEANGKLMLAHATSAQGISVAERVTGKDHVLNHLSVPAACFTHPEISMIGLTGVKFSTLNVHLSLSEYPAHSSAEEDETLLLSLSEYPAHSSSEEDETLLLSLSEYPAHSSSEEDETLLLSLSEFLILPLPFNCSWRFLLAAPLPI